MSLKESTIDNVKTRQDWLRQAERAVVLVDSLPTELQALEGSADTGSDKYLSVTFHQYNNQGVDLVKVCKMAGVQGLVTKMWNPNDWYAHGEMAMGDVTVKVSINGLPNPPTCIIEPYTETVTKYRAICEQTGEEIR